jgi:predicted XRE-type DNA-binding protein
MTEERQRFESVWDAIEDSSEQAAGMRRRSEIMLTLRGHIEAWGCTQAEAAERLAVTQPRLNDLMRGRIHRFNLEALIALAERAGFDVRIDLGRAA